MPAPVYPSGVTVQGNVKLAFVPTIAAVAAPKIATEINAAGSLDISCYVSGDSWKPTIDQNKGEAPRRLCTKATRDVFGNVKYTLPDLVYSYNPQGVAATDGVKAAEVLVPGTSGFIVERLGLDAVGTDWVIGQFVNVWAVTLGRQQDWFDPGDEFNEFMKTQALVIGGNGTPTVRSVLAA